METSRSSEGPTVFQLADIVNLYTKCLEQLGVEAPAVNSTRLKEKLLSEVPELEAHKQGKDVLLAFQKNVSFVLSDASDYYSEAIILDKAANILRRHMLNHKSNFVEPIMRDAFSRPFHPLFFSLWPCLSTEQTSNHN